MGVTKRLTTSNRDETAEIVTAEGRTRSLLAGISSRFISEESAIQHDLYNWEDIRNKSHEFGVSTFQQGDRVLEVIYANRNGLEKALGVDLIYHNVAYGSFVLVQYKLMSEEGKEEGFVYRPDAQFDKELLRMNEFMSTNAGATELASHEDYRILRDGFLFKLVPNKGFRVASAELVSGMYITREYMNFLNGEKGPKGPRGGRVLGFRKSPRYLTNTEFTSMVNRGWIGTNGQSSSVLSQLITGFLESGNSLLVAVEADTANKTMEPTA